MALCGLAAVGLGAGYHVAHRPSAPTTVIVEAADDDDGPRGGIGIIELREAVREREVAGNDTVVDDSYTGEIRVRHGRVRRGHPNHYPRVGLFEDIEDEYIVGHLVDDAEDGLDGELDGEFDDDGEDGQGGSGRIGDARGSRSWCATSLLCVLASAAGTGPAPPLPSAAADGYLRAREHFRAGRFRAAAAGFLAIARAAGAPAIAPLGSTLRASALGAVDRDLLCLQAAASLLAAAGDDGDPSTAAGEDAAGDPPMLLASLGPCAPQALRLFGHGDPSTTSYTPTRLPDDTGPRPDATHL